MPRTTHLAAGLAQINEKIEFLPLPRREGDVQ